MSAHLKPACLPALFAAVTVAALAGGSGPASASCAVRVSTSASGHTKAEAFAMAVGSWQAKVANTINDLYSDWSYAREKSSSTRSAGHKYIVSVSARPCNS